MMETHAVVHVCGSPASGKSTLLKLLANYIRLNKPEYSVVILEPCENLNIWGYREYLLDSMCFPINRGTEQNLEHDKNLVFLIDEVQFTYKNIDFWNCLIKNRCQESSYLGSKLVLFASYGNSREPYLLELDGTRGCSLPPIFLQQRVSALRSQSNSSNVASYLSRPDVALYFSRSEFGDAVQRYLETSECLFKQISKGARNIIWRETMGHPGMVRCILDCLHAVWLS
jgi:energy-coupling factor transporter ATP-binding protein EcfA2